VDSAKFWTQRSRAHHDDAPVQKLRLALAAAARTAVEGDRDAHLFGRLEERLAIAEIGAARFVLVQGLLPSPRGSFAGSSIIQERARW